MNEAEEYLSEIKEDPKIKLLVNDVRISKGISKKKLSETSGVGRTTITEIETLNRYPSIYTMVKLAIALECKVDELIKIER